MIDLPTSSAGSIRGALEKEKKRDTGIDDPERSA
jgi:hypothetical protein